MLLTGNQILALKENKVYKKTGGLKYNIIHINDIRTSKLNGISCNVSASKNGLGVSATFGFVSIIWFALQFYFIKKEIVLCRRDIIENLLDKEIMKKRDVQLIEDAIDKAKIYWLDFEYGKVKKIRMICKAFLEDRAIRKVLLEYSNEGHAARIEQYAAIQNEMEKLFDRTLENLSLEEFYDRMRKDPYAIRDAIIRNFTGGNLTDSRRGG